MKVHWILLLALIIVNAFGIDYSDASNWVICDDKEAVIEQKFDVFYIYPTLFASKEKPLMDWSEKALAKKTVEYSKSQARLWGKEARVFAPYVRQLEYARCIALLKSPSDWENSMIKQGIEDTKEAFSYYMKSYNKGRPFILFGHSQGAMDLYYMLKENVTISVKSGFVAAYLIGLPCVTEKQLRLDFTGREILPATKKDDIGTVIAWNTQTKEAAASLFSGPDVLCINPLNWSISETYCSPECNLGAVIYNYKDGSYMRKSNFCGAFIDKQKGALIAVLPDDSPYLKINHTGKGILHAYDIFFFAENIKANAVERVNKWKSCLYMQ